MIDFVQKQKQEVTNIKKICIWGSRSRKTFLQREPLYHIQKGVSLIKDRDALWGINNSLCKCPGAGQNTAELEKLREKHGVYYNEWERRVWRSVQEPSQTLHALKVASLLYSSAQFHLATQHNRPVPDSSHSPPFSTPGLLSYGLNRKTNTLWPLSALFQQLPQ